MGMGIDGYQSDGCRGYGLRTRATPEVGYVAKPEMRLCSSLGRKSFKGRPFRAAALSGIAASAFTILARHLTAFSAVNIKLHSRNSTYVGIHSRTLAT